jgi:hypothetical protein
MGLLPQISLSGAKITLPTARPNKYVVTPRVDSVVFVSPNSFIIMGRPEV